MPLTNEVATLWIASFALAYSVFGAQRLPSFWSQEYANGKHHQTTRWFAYLFFPIWMIVLSCQAAAYATFLQEVVNDLYYAFLVVGIAEIGLMHTWNWAWNFPVHPWLAAIVAFLIFGCQLTLLILAIVYDTTNNWVYAFICIPLAWTAIAAIWSIVSAVRISPEFYEMQDRVRMKDNRLHQFLKMDQQRWDSMMGIQQSYPLASKFRT
jgi:hypothetical protein